MPPRLDNGRGGPGTDAWENAVSQLPPEKQHGYLNYAEQTYREYTEFFESDGDVKIGPHTVQGLGLPDAILEKIYRTNAQNWYPGL